MSGSAPEAGAWTYVELLLVTLIWGTGSVAIKIAVQGFPPLTAAGLRVALAAAVYALLLWLSRRPGKPGPRAADLPLLIWLALSGFALFNVVYFLALQRTTASHAVLVWGAQPIVTAVLAALLLGERLTRRALAGVVLSVAGVGMIVASSLDAQTAYGADLLGDLLLVAMMLLWVLYSVGSRAAMTHFSALAATGYACLIGFVLILPVSLLSGARPQTLTAAPPSAWLAIAFSGAISAVLMYILWNRALLRLGPTRSAVFVNLAPLWGLLMSRLVVGEALGWVHLAGAALIIGGVLVANVRGSRQSAVGSRVTRAARGTQ